VAFLRAERDRWSTDLEYGFSATTGAVVMPLANTAQDSYLAAITLLLGKWNDAGQPERRARDELCAVLRRLGIARANAAGRDSTGYIEDPTFGGLLDAFDSLAEPKNRRLRRAGGALVRLDTFLRQEAVWADRLPTAEELAPLVRDARLVTNVVARCAGGSSPPRVAAGKSLPLVIAWTNEEYERDLVIVASAGRGRKEKLPPATRQGLLFWVCASPLHRMVAAHAPLTIAASLPKVRRARRRAK